MSSNLVYGPIPALKEKKALTRFALLHFDPSYPIAEAFRLLRRNIGTATNASAFGKQC